MVTLAIRRLSPPNPDPESIEENLITQDSGPYLEQLKKDSR